MAKHKHTGTLNGTAAFTLIEIIITMVILAIAALIAVPMMSSAADMQVRSAANRLAADLDYARNMAITHQRPFSVVFTTAGYTLQDISGPIKNPLRPGTDYTVAFGAGERGMSQVQIAGSAFVDSGGATETSVTFDYLGTPYCGTTTANILNSGTITLSDTTGTMTLYVKVEPMTGYVTITSTP